MKNLILETAINNLGVMAFEYGMAKARQVDCEGYVDAPWHEKQVALKESTYIKAQDHLKDLLGIKND